MLNRFFIKFAIVEVVFYTVFPLGLSDLHAQSSAQKQAPATAPQVQEVLPSYEGQNVSAMEVAGKPGLDESQLETLFVQKAGQPFEKAKVDQTMAALKNRGIAKEIELEIRPQPDGIRILFVLQPALLLWHVSISRGRGDLAILGCCRWRITLLVGLIRPAMCRARKQASYNFSNRTVIFRQKLTRRHKLTPRTNW